LEETNDMKRRLVTIAVAATLAAGSRDARCAGVPATLGVGVGYVKASSVQATVVFGADFRFHLSKHFAVSPEVTYWKRSAPEVLVASSVKDLQFGANLLGVVRPGSKVELFLGGGGGVHQIGGAVSIGGLQASQSLTKGGVDVVGGLTLEVADDLGFFLAARYDWVLGLGGDDPSRLDQYRVLGGFRLRF
jgi:hypothetical protein